MRTSGVLRVILNAHVVAGMKVELANDNCLRFTNVDGIYLIKVCCIFAISILTRNSILPGQSKRYRPVKLRHRVST